MGASRGIQAVKLWAKTLSKDITRVVLSAELATTDGEVIAEWDKAETTLIDGTDDEILGFRDKGWPQEAWDLAQQDCVSRGQSLRYSVRAFVDDEARPRSRTYMSMVAPREKPEDDAGAALDGSMHSILAQLQKGQQDANRMLLEFVKLEQQSKTSTNALVTQLSASLRDREEMISKLVDMRTAEALDTANAAIANAKTGPNESDQAFIKFAAEALPHALPALLEHFGPFIARIMSAASSPAAPSHSAAASVPEVIAAATITS